MNRTLIKQKAYSIKPFKEIVIGDPEYFEELEQDFVFESHSLPVTGRYAKVYLQLHKYSEDNISYNLWVMKFFTIVEEQGKELEHTLLNGMYHPDLLLDEKELGCDGARFRFQVDGREDIIHTGGDGYYGHTIQYKDNRMHFFELSFDTNLFGEKDLEHMIHYFFQVVKEEEWEVNFETMK